MADIYDNNENLMLNLSVAQQINPDLAGEAQRLSQETGIPPDVAQNNIEEARKQAKMRQAQALKLSKLDPILARQLEDPSFAAIAHDQLEPLTGVGKVFNWFGSPSDISKGYDIGQMQQDASVLKYKKRIGEITPEQSAKLGSLESQLKALTEGRPEPGVFGQTGEVIGQMSRTMPEAIKAGLWTATGAGAIGLAAGPLSPITVPAATIGGFIAGMGSSVLKQTQHTESAEVYEDMIAEGVDEQTALYASAGVGLVNGVLEAANVGVLASPFKKALSKLATEEIATLLTKPTMKAALREFGVSYGKAVASETATELSQEFTSIAGEEIAKQISKPEFESKLSTPEGQKEIAQRLGSVVEQTIKGMVFLAAPGPAINFRMDMKRVDDAKRDAQFIDALTQQSVDSVVRKRNPDAWESFIANQAGNGPAENIYIDAQQFQNVLNQQGLTKEQLSASLPDIASQVDTAVQSGGDIVIPTSVYAGKIAGTEIGDALKPHMRVDENGISITEALDIESQKEELKKNAQAVLEEKMARDQAFIDSAKDVEKQLFSQIKETGTYRDKVSKDFATFVRDFVVTQSADLGVLPTAFYDEYKLKLAKAQEQQEVYNQFAGKNTSAALATDQLPAGIGVEKSEMGINKLNDSAEYEKALSGFINHYGDETRAKENIDNYKSKVDSLIKNGGEVYRVIFANSPEKIKTDDFGRHWVTDYADLERIGNNLRDNFGQGKNAYIIEANVPSGVTSNKSVDLENNPEELEVNLAGDLTGVSYKIYEANDRYQPGALANNPNILKQGAPEGGANAITGDLERVNPDVRDAVESRIARLPEEDQQRVRDNLEKYKGTAWAAAAVKGMAYREMLDRAMANEDISNLERNPIWGKQDMSATKLIQAFKKYPSHGERVLKLLLNAYDFIGGNRKAENDISTSFANCDPSKACAVHCYAAGSNARPNEIAKSEFTEFMIEHFPMEMADKIASDYLATEAGKSGLSLRLNDKGDLSPAQVKLIELLNDKGIAVQVFSKRPELLRSLSDVNLKMLSVDGTNMDVAAANPDLRLAVTITDEMTEAMLTPLQDRVSVYLPVNLKGKAVTAEELKSRFPNLYGRMRKENLCPVDGGKLITKPGTSFVDIRDKTADKGVWTCTACDLYGNAGCFKGDRQTNQRKAQTIMVSDLKRELEVKKVRKDLQANLETLLQLGGIDGELYSQLSQALSSGQRAILEIADTERATRGTESASGTTEEGQGSGSGTGLDTGGTYKQGSRGGFDPESLTVILNQKADYSTFLHETAHFFLTAYSDLAAKPNATERMKADMQTLLDWFGVSDLETWNAMSLDQQRKYHEQFAYNFELYLFEGKAPNTKLQAIFDNFSRWLKRVYISIRDDLNALYREENGEDLPILTGEVRQVMDRMIASDEQIAQAEQINNMKGIYQSQEQSGMDDNAWAAYQEMIKEARDAGVTELTKATLRQMKWLSNAKSRVLKEMQATANAQRREVRADVRMEVLARPIYRAYVALTAKITGEDKITPISPRKSDPNIVDPTMDSLAMAIAKLGGLDKQELIEEWGIDPKYNPASGVFGKPVLRLSGGLSRETMAEHLVDLGYLSFDKNGRYDLQEFEQKLDEQLRGRDQYSMQYYPEAEMRAGDQIINPAALMAMRFDSVELALLHLPEEVINVIQSRNMVAKDGLHPDIVASLFGFSSGDELVRQLAEVPPPKEAIETLTDQRMLEEYSELSDPKAMEDEVQKALHNEARARFVAVELRYLAKATAPVRVMMNAAKQVAKQILSNKKLSEIKPREYTSAEARAAKQAETFMKKGQSQEAQKAKQNQLVQNQLAAEALAAKAEVMKSLQSFKKVFKADDKLAKTRNMDLVNVCRSILSFYGIGAPKGKSPMEFVEKLRTYNAEMYAEIEPLILDAATGQKQFTDLTLDEFRSLRDTIESLWFQSRREHEIMIEGKLIDKQIAIDALNSRLEEIGIPEEIAGERMAPSNKERMFRSFNNTKAMLRRIEHWADATDGAAGVGPFTTYIFRPVSQALSKYRNLRNDYVKRYAESIATLSLPVAKIESPPSELNYTFGNNNGGIGKAELLGAMLHRGNTSNFRKLLLAGRGGIPWGELNADGSLNASRWMAFEKRMQDEGILTKADYDWLQSVWDLCEEMKPLAQKAHHDIFGYYFKEIEYSPVVTPWGVYKGGYVPAKTDPFLVRDARINAKMDELEGDFRNSMPSTGYGFTKGRVEYNKPLSLDIRTMTKHIDDVIRFAMVQPAIKDVLSLIKSRSFADNLTRIDSSAIETMLLPWLNRAARNITTEAGMHKGIDKFWSGVRSRTGISIMFANITNALQQLTGYFPAMLKVDKTYLKESLVSYMSNTQKITEEVAEMSEFMKSRLSSQMFDIQDNMNELLLNPSNFDKIQTWSQHHGYFLQTSFQNQVDIVTWTATYNQTLAELGAGVDDKQANNEAIQRADAAVRLTQGSLSAEDIAAFEVGSPFYKTLIQFSGYFNMLANLNVNEYVKVFRDMGWKGNKGQLFMIYMLGFGLPMLVSDAIVRSLGGQWDDEDDDGYTDEFMEWFFGSQIKGAVALVPFGTAAMAPFNAFNNKAYDDRITTSPSVSALESATIGVVKTGINIVEGKDVTGKNIRDTLTFLSLATGTPLTILGRPTGYAVDVEHGEINPTSTVDFARGLITGKASEESKK